MVMLDFCMRELPLEELVVATFDHGTRESAKEDVEFVTRRVEELGAARGVPTEVRRDCSAKVSGISSALQMRVYQGSAELGAGASEERARAERYQFLRKVAFLEKGEIFTAHHLDDLVETVAINFLRGTGIRGLAPFSSPGIRRPFLEGAFGEVLDKRGVLKIAAERGVRFREDPTNSSSDYLRNRVRERVREKSQEEKMKVFELFLKQKAVVGEIEKILEAILPEDLRFLREDFREMPEEVGREILREGLGRAGISATRPQIQEFLTAIQTYQTGKKFNLPGDRLVEMRREDFQILC